MVTWNLDGKFLKHLDSRFEGGLRFLTIRYSALPQVVWILIFGYAGVDVMDNNIEGTLHTMRVKDFLVPVLPVLPTQL